MLLGILAACLSRFLCAVESNLGLLSFSFISLSDFSREIVPLPQPIKCKFKPIAIRLLPRVFPRQGSLFVVTLSPNWPSVMFFFLWYGAGIRLVSRYFLLPLNLISRALSLPPQRKCFREGKRERALVIRLYYHYVFLQCGFERRIK